MVQQDELAVGVSPPPEPAAAAIPSSSAAGQLQLQQANMAVAAPAPSLTHNPNPAVVPSDTPTPALQIPPTVISQIVSSVTAEVTRNIQHILPSAPGSSSAPEAIPPTAPAAVVVAANAITGSEVPVAVPSSSSGISEEFTPAGLPLDARVYARAKAQIWANDFVDLAVLLNKNNSSTNFQFTLSQSADSLAPTLTLEPTTKSAKITNSLIMKRLYRSSIKQSCKDKTLMFFVRKMVSICLTHNILTFLRLDMSLVWRII